MDEIILECMYEEDCSFLTDRTYVPMLAFEEMDEHLQEEHDTNLEDEIEQLEEEVGMSFEELIRQGGIEED